MITWLRSVLVAYVAIVPWNVRADDDAAYLRDGGEIRGSLIERIANSEIVMRAGDGSIRRIPLRDVVYLGRHGTGGLRVTTEKPGIVELDGRAMGGAPLQLENIDAGPHQVRIGFDDGGFAEQTLVVQSGRFAAAHFVPTILQLAGIQREGTHLVVGAGALIGAIDTRALRGGGAAGLHVGLNVGLSSTAPGA